MLSDDDLEKFKIWLKKNTNLGDATITDTVCRLGRANRILPVQTNIPIDDFLFKLSKKQDFSNLGTTIKSQLRRACKLYYVYKS